jgi:regulatory protein
MRKGGSASAPPSPVASSTSSPSGEPASPRAGLPTGSPKRANSRTANPGRDAQPGGRGFAHSGEAYSSPAELGDDGGAVFEVPFEAFFGEPAAEQDAPAEPQGDRYERSSATRAARESAREKSSAARQRPERSLKGRALGYLSRREYSRAELSRKLVPYTEDADALEALLDSLQREGWLSDARFAESVVHRRAARVGAGRIVSELKRHAVGDALIEEVSTQLRETELVRARAVWQKKYGQLPETPSERARQARFLAARGFSMSIIGKILKGIEDDWSGD